MNSFIIIRFSDQKRILLHLLSVVKSNESKYPLMGISLCCLSVIIFKGFRKSVNVVDFVNFVFKSTGECLKYQDLKLLDNLKLISHQ